VDGMSAELKARIKLLREVFLAYGKKGGRSRSAKKVAAARENVAKARAAKQRPKEEA